MNSLVGVGISPGGNVPVYHGHARNPILVERRVRIVELVLRVLVCGLGALAAALVGFDSQIKVIFTIQKEAKYTDTKALVFLVVVNGIVAAYSLVHVVRCVVSMVKGSVLFNKPLAWAIFSGDQVMSYINLAAVAAVLQTSVIAKQGQPELQWMQVCNLFDKFCNRAGEGTASALMVCICSALISAISAYSLFRLYGGKKGKTGSSSVSW